MSSIQKLNNLKQMNFKYIPITLSLAAATLLCSSAVALFTACTNQLADETTLANPVPALPQGALALSIDLPGTRPAFDENQPGTRAIPTVPGATSKAEAWQEGDELLLMLSLSDGTKGNSKIYTYLQYSNGAWKLLPQGYVATVVDKTLQYNSYADMPLFVINTEGEIVGLRLPIGVSLTSWQKAQITLHYAPGVEWADYNSNPIDLVPGDLAPKSADITPAMIQQWSASLPETSVSNGGFVFNFTGGGGNASVFKPLCSRLRVYTGRPDDKVQMVATDKLEFALGSQTADYTYTATTDANGNAYFYGRFGSTTQTTTISLPEVEVPGQSGTESKEVYKGVLSITDASSNTAYGLTKAIDASFVLPSSIVYFAPATEYSTDYDGFVSALTTAATDRKNIWMITGTENAELGGSGKTVLAAIQEALKAVYTANPAKRIHLYLPHLVVDASANMFDGCYALERVSLPAEPTTKKLDDKAFANCTNLKSVSLARVRTLGNQVFANCTKLESVSLPYADTFGNEVFVNCANLKSVSLPVAKTLGSQIFGGCNTLTDIYLKQSVGWVSMTSSFFENFAPAATCTVHLKNSSYNTVGADGKSWTPLKRAGSLVPVLTDGFTTFVSTAAADNAPDKAVHPNIVFIAED